jgi:hypothetical protein
LRRCRRAVDRAPGKSRRASTGHDRGPKLAVIGPTADDQLAMFSGYSFPVHLIVANMQEDRVNMRKLRCKLIERFGELQYPLCQGLRDLTERNPRPRSFR